MRHTLGELLDEEVESAPDDTSNIVASDFSFEYLHFHQWDKIEKSIRKQCQLTICIWNKDEEKQLGITIEDPNRLTIWLFPYYVKEEMHNRLKDLELLGIIWKEN